MILRYLKAVNADVFLDDNIAEGLEHYKRQCYLHLIEELDV